MMKSLPALSTLVFSLVLLFSCVLVLSSAPKAHAALSQVEFESSLNELSESSSVAHMFGSLVGTGNAVIYGCISEVKDACPQELKFGAIQTMGTMIAALYDNPPVSGVAYLADVGERLKIVKPAYAQEGTGFNALRPILPIWRAFRNFAYIIFVIIFVAIGLAIMFRVKISPQAVITIQSALPRIVIALLLVTFSYAIVGFMIDLIYVLMSLSILVFAGAVDSKTISDLQTQLVNGNFLTAMFALGKLVPVGLMAAFAAFGGLIGGIAGALLGTSFVIGPATAPLITLAGGGTIAVVGAAVGALFLGILVLYLVIKLLIELIKAYFGILLAVVLAPLQLLLGALPLEGAGFGSWFKGLLVNILIFPAVAFVLIIGRVLGQTASGAPLDQPLWSAPLLVGGVGDDVVTRYLVGAVIGIGTLLVVHQIPNAIRQAFKSEGILGTAIGQTAGALTGTTRGAGEAYLAARVLTAAPTGEIREGLLSRLLRGYLRGGGRLPPGF